VTRYQRLAKKAIAARLQGEKEPVLLFTLSVVADQAARQAGKKRDLYGTLYDYEGLLPADWSPKWLTTPESSAGSGFLMAVPVDWRPGAGSKLIHGKVYY